MKLGRLGARCLVIALMLPASIARPATVLDCDRASSAHEVFQLGDAPAPACLSGGPTGSFLRLADTATVNINAIAFDLSDPGVHDLIVADFDFRMTPRGAESRADGFGFTLASTARFGASGPVTGHSEEADVEASLGFGFDIHRGPGEGSRNHVSVHFDAVKLAEVDATPLLELASGQWTHARIVVRAGATPPDVTLTLTPCGSTPVTLIDRLVVPGLAPYEARVHLMGRSGGEAALHDLDNLNVQFLSLSQGTVQLANATSEVTEGSHEAIVTVSRTGDLGDAIAVGYSTADLTATAGADYTPVSGVLEFESGEETTTVRVAIRDDVAMEGDERFVFRLEAPSDSVALGGPNETHVTIVDDEAARSTGRWSGVMCWPIVAIHGVSLPDGRVMLWPGDEGPHGSRDGDLPHAWSPADGSIRPLEQAGYDIFCSGHTLTADGKVLVAGGHVMEAVGLARASLYDPASDAWTYLPDMNAGRWYPTTTTLANGDVLVLSGSVDETVDNTLPQIRPETGGAWRDLTGARLGDPELARYYPWTYVAPDGRVFCAGRQQSTWYLDPRGTGSWAPVSPSGFGTRDYGSSVMYEPGKVLIVGGNPRGSGTPMADVPTATAEVIDLSEGTPAWRDVAPMAMPRRQLNTTLLPDGTVLATGGTSGPGFNNAAGAALAAELWDPETEGWTTLASMQVPRLYHSIGMLLADGRVLVAGGGLPAALGDVNHPDAQIFSPPYLYKGSRPRVTSSPLEVSYGEAFLVETPDAARIASVTWVRLSSVTHSFNENQRMNRLSFSLTRAGLFAVAPRDSNLCPPGHYFLFVLDQAGVPSEGRVIRVSRPAAGEVVPGSTGLTLRGARPHPAPHGLVVEFALLDASPAELSVYDLFGRLVHSREVGGLGVGAHVLDIGTPTGMAPGVYLVRLEQSGRSASTKAVVLRP